MREIERITDQLKRAFLGDAWHGPALMELLEGVTPEQAAARPLPKAHNIWEIVLHIAAWKEAVRRRLRGDAVELSPDQDWPRLLDTSEKAWISALEALKRAHNQLERTVADLQDSELPGRVPGKPQEHYTVYYMLHGVIQHDLYHAGQIALLKKT